MKRSKLLLKMFTDLSLISLRKDRIIEVSTMYSTLQVLLIDTSFFQFSVKKIDRSK